MPSVLVVDDNEGTCDLIGRVLRRSGYDVAYVTSGAEALALLRDIVFDLVVVDWMMPDMDGLEVLRRLRSEPHKSRVPVLLYSAAGDLLMEQEAMRLGAVGVVLKSGGFGALHDSIRQQLPLAPSSR